MFEMLKCLFCGTKGGAVNQLLVAGVQMNNQIYRIAECEWCSANTEASRLRWILQQRKEGDL